MSNVTPSSIARRIAQRMWPDVQEQKKLTAGVYEFESAGHGGMVAILNNAQLPENAVEAARKLGMVDIYAVVRTGARRTTLTLESEYWSEESRVEYLLWLNRAKNAGRLLAYGEVWVGEEDCAWAPLVVSSPTLHEAWLRSRSNEQTSPEQIEALARYPRENCSRWNKDFLAELEGSTA